MTEKDRECLRALYLIDPTADIKAIVARKDSVFKDSYSWILECKEYQKFMNWEDGNKHRLLWIKGDPGKGKTMLLVGVIREIEQLNLNPESLNLSYFFCQGTDEKLNTPTAVLRCLVWLVLSHQPSLISHLRDKYDTAGGSVFDGDYAFYNLADAFKHMLKDTRLKRVLLVVDALDECLEQRKGPGLAQLLDLISTTVAEFPKVKWLVSSRRNISAIESVLPSVENVVTLDLESNSERIRVAVDAYIENKVSELDKPVRYKPEDRVKISQELRQKADGTFLWVALVCKELEGVRSYDALDVLRQMPSGLKDLYDRMMSQIKELKRNDPKYCKSVLSTMTLVYRPLHVSELAVLSDLSTNVPVREIIKICASFLTVRNDIVYLVHQSAQDYLTKDAESEIWPEGRAKGHAMIVKRSLHTMGKTLRRDIYNLRRPGLSIKEVKAPDPDPLTPIRYACLSWIDHLSETDPNLYDQLEPCNVFMKKQFLYWLEALSLMGNMSSGVVMIKKLENLLAEAITDDSGLLELVRDAQRFIRHNKWVIENTPLQAYASALVFSPTHSLMRQLWEKEEPEWIITKPRVDSDWSPCLQTLEGHSARVRSVAFSHDSQQLASCSSDGTIKIWDSLTGKCQQTLEGHSSDVTSIDFLDDSRRLASASADQTVRIWDAATGLCLETRTVDDLVTFSPDARRDVSISQGSALAHIIKIWDAETGKCLRTLKGHDHLIWSIVFSPDSLRLASASADHTAKIWDATTGECIQTLEHFNFVTSVAFSPDSQLAASGSEDHTIKIWDAQTGGIQMLQGHKPGVLSLAFSHDSRQLGSGSRGPDCTVKIWNLKTGQCTQTLMGHTGSVISLAFSHDSRLLASSSVDTTIKIWDATTGKCMQMFEGHSTEVASMAVSPDSQKFLSISQEDWKVKIWDTTAGECIQTLDHGTVLVHCAVFSHDSQQLALGSANGKVSVWDPVTSQCLQNLKGHDTTLLIKSLTFSHDSRQLASASKEIKIWDLATSECLQTIKPIASTPLDWFDSVAFSNDSQQLASGWNHSVYIWDAATGICLQELKHGSAPSIESVAFSRGDSWKLASFSWDGTVKLWDAVTWACLQTFYLGTTSHLAFDPTDSYLITDIGAISVTAEYDSNADTAAGVDSVADKTCQLVKWYGYGLSLDRVWITWGGQNVLWIPSEYRPERSLVFGSTVAIGGSTGRVFIIRFSPTISPVIS